MLGEGAVRTQREELRWDTRGLGGRSQPGVPSQRWWIAGWEGVEETHGGPPCRHHPRDGGVSLLQLMLLGWWSVSPFPQRDCSTPYVSLTFGGEAGGALFWNTCN